MEEKINFAGGEVRAGRALHGTEVWNRDPLPPPPPPKQYLYCLTVCQPSPNDAEMKAVAGALEMLLEFEAQTRALGYEFIKLERLNE